MNVTAEIQHRPAQPRSERDAAFLERFDARMRLPIIVSAILPLIVAPESNDWLGVVVGITTWLAAVRSVVWAIWLIAARTFWIASTAEGLSPPGRRTSSPTGGTTAA